MQMLTLLLRFVFFFFFHIKIRVRNGIDRGSKLREGNTKKKNGINEKNRIRYSAEVDTATHYNYYYATHALRADATTCVFFFFFLIVSKIDVSAGRSEI